MTSVLRSSPVSTVLDDIAAPLVDALFRQVPIGITIASAPDVEILRVSEYGSQLLGRPRNDLEHINADKHVEAYQIFDPISRTLAETERLPLVRAVQMGETVEGEEWLVGCENGRLVPIICNAGPIRRDDGAIIGGVVTWSDFSRQKELEEQLRLVIVERDSARAELDHRMKNHLALVAAMVGLEAKGRSDDACQFASAVSAKVMALSHAYSVLEGQSGNAASAADLLKAVATPLSTPHVSIEVTVEANLMISADQCAPLGIMVNEAICNALKHGYPEGQSGLIEVSLMRKDGGLELTIVNDGVPLPAVMPRKGRGSKFIAALVRQLKGTMTFANTDADRVAMTVQFSAPDIRLSTVTPYPAEV